MTQLEKQISDNKNKNKKIDKIQREMLNDELEKVKLGKIRSNHTQISTILNKINEKIEENKKLII